MRKILSLCINLLLLIITDAVPLQLIPGNRSVVKKDGATHTISKYYIVPNDFDPNNVTNSTKASETTLRVNSHYSKSMDASGDQVSEKNDEAANDQTNENNADVNNTAVSSSSGMNDAQVEVATQANDISKSTGSVSTGQSLDLDDLGNVQVEPITYSININSSDTINKINVYNSSKTLQIGTSLVVENATKTYESDVEDDLDELILTKFGIAVQESSVLNLESFWKLIKLTIDRTSDNDELMAKIEKLSLLLNIFTNLYEAAQSQKPIESMIDSIIDILQIPFVKKSTTSESQSQTDVSGDYDEECLRKCGLKRSNPQLDSNSTILSETEGRDGSDDLELEKLDLKRRHRGDSDDDWVNTSNVPVSNQATVSNQPTNILRSQLLVPNNLNVGVPDGYNVRSSISTPTHVTRNNDIQEDPKSNQIISDTPKSSRKADEPLTFESILTEDWPRTIKDKLTQNIPWTIQTMTDDLPWRIEDKTTDDLPWHIEDKTTDDLPWHIEDKTTDDLPWHIEDKAIDHNPITIDHRTTHILPWSIEDTGTKNVHWKVEKRAPITLYQSRDPSFRTHPNQPMTGTVHSIKHGFNKPYHIYTYVINPATSLYEIPNSDNIDNVKSRQPNDNLGTKVYGLSSHGGNKIVYTNKPSPSYDESQFSLSKPIIDISQTSHSQSKHTNYVTYGTSNEVNPLTLISETPQDNYEYQPKYFVGHVPETNHKPVLLQPNTFPLDFQTNSYQENEEPQVPEVGSHPGVLLPNIPSNPYGSWTINGPESTASASASAVTLDIEEAEPNPYNPNINLNHMQQKNSHPGLISKTVYHSEYTNLSDDDDEPSPVYGGYTDKHPGLISTPSSISEYTNLPDDYAEPVYGGQTHQHPDLISSSAYSSSGYTNLPDEPDDLVYNVQTHQHPGLITSSASSNSEYTNVADDFDESNPVYGGQTHKYPGFISEASSHSKYTNLPNDYNNPTPDYEQQTNIHPGLITKVNHYPEYNNVVDVYDEPIPVYGEEIHKHPGLISSSASSYSEYTNLPNDYNNPTDDYEEDTDRYPVHVQTPTNGRPTENEDNLLVSYHPYGHTVNIIQPSLITHLQGNQPTGLHYLKHLKLTLVPTYRLFTLDNLLKLRHVVMKTIEVNGEETDVYDDNRALMNLMKIIDIILKLAEHLEEPEGSIEWYEKIFYNTQKNRHPLEIYVHNLIRQRWLHELMLILHNNDFNLNILLNPRIFSFLGSWQFPHYILNFVEREELIQHNVDAPEVFDQTFSTQHGLQDKFATHTYADLLKEVPEDLENYVTNNVINSYKTPSAGIVLSIAGVEAEPDANAIINILQKYLHYKSFIEKQENVIIRDNKFEMLNQIILFLREKGYGATTIADLIRKLYTAVYSTEGKGCQTHQTNFAKNMYDVILPVLRRSGQ